MKALLIVDIQNDFLPSGALAVEDGDEVIPKINRLVKRDFDHIIASKDWHPPNHGSFAESHDKNPGEHILLKGLNQILWPAHCVQNTFGAEFADILDVSRIEKVFFKGTDPEIDSYSAFYDNGHLKSTGLGDYLLEKGVTDIYIVGLTTDYCVKYSTLDAKHLGFNVYVIIDACRPVNLRAGDNEKAIEEMKKAGAKIITSSDVT